MFQSSQIIVLIVLTVAVTCFGENLPPIFSADMNQHVLSESTPPGTQVYTLQANDPENGTLNYFIKGTDMFTVDNQTGAVFLTVPLDREVNDSLKFTVAVEDDELNVSEIPITVIVADENDNPSAFSQAIYEAKVGEKAAVGTLIIDGFVVTDADVAGDIIEVSCGQNDDFCDSISIVPSVSSASFYRGNIILRKPLSSQPSGPLSFLLVAKDGVHTTTAEVRISVEGIRSNAPVFMGPRTGLVVEGVEIGTLVMTIQAKNGQSTDNPRKVVYKLLENSDDTFEMDLATGELRTAKEIDRESLEATNFLSVKVRAIQVDNSTGEEMESTDGVFTIVVQDANDEAPKFSQNEFFALIHENVPSGTPLSGLSIVASDQDSDMNAMFDLELIDASGLFTVEPKSATGSTNVAIRLANGPLDYENPNHQKFILVVVARESNTKEKMSSTATVRVTVQDENDNSPVFDRELYTVAINENAANDTQIASIPATDRDSGLFGDSGLKYELMGDNADKFIIDEETAVIRTAPCPTPGRAPCLDYETRSTYFLTLKVSDDQGRGNNAMVPVRIDLVDSNDNPPHFEQFLFHASVDEGASKFDPPFRVRARDDDLTSVLTYSIIAGNTEDLFTINSRTGEIGVTKPLELNSSLVPTEEFTLSVEVTDGSSQDTATLKISIRDVNNNPPIFQEPVYNASISELAQPGTKLIETLATDADFGENARLTYKIERSSFNKFRIDPVTGVIQVTRPLDFDERNAYNIQIIAVDNGSPALTGSATVFVTVEDRNNKKPQFVPVSQHAQTVETSNLNTVVHTLTAVDPDALRGSLRYSLIEPITAVDKDGREVRTNLMYKNFFAVNPLTGEIFVSEHLDRGAAAVVTLTTLITDTSANPPQEGRGMVTITILDVNDHEPTFSRPWSSEEPFLSLEVFEEQPIGSVVGQISATDPDSAIDHYEILPASPFFDIDRHTGIVTNKQRLDFESTPDFNFTVVVYDAGIPQMSSTAQVTVALRNVNDQSPIFSSKSYETRILENSQAGTPVLTVSATDGDAGSFGLITYSLTGENAKYFSIDASGVITVADPNGLDRERSPLITLLVAASDLAPPGARRTTIIPVEIHLDDVNDNGPNFLVNNYRATVAETVPLLPPPPIVQVTAIDRDAGLNSALRYDIIGGNEDGLFRLDPLTGILYPVVTLAGKPREYNLVVEVRDLNGTGTNSDRATVTIIVQSVNQHKPKFSVPSASNATVRVPENAGVESYLVLTLKAEDVDPGENGRVSYHIRVGEQLVQQTPEFQLDAVTGELRTRLTLDRETQASYELLLVAKDGGLQTSYETLRLLTVIVDDEDDNQPQFPPERRTQVAPYHFRIEENVRPDTAVGQVQAFDPDVGTNARIYYHIIEGNEGNWFYIDRTNGYVFNRIVLDREQRSKYDLLIKATNDPQFQGFDPDREKRQVMVDPSIAQVHIDVVDINDNPPHFEKDTFYAGVDYSSNSDKFLLQIRASDPDEGINGSLSYFIRSSNLYHMGSNVSSGSVVPSPFHVTPDGRLKTDSLMAEYNQDRFVLEVVAREEAAPFREDSARVHVWVYEPDQLARIVVAKPLETAIAERETFGDELRNATQLLIVIDELRHHVEEDGSLNKNQCDVYVHGVDQASNTIALVPDVLRAIDLHYDVLRSFNDTAIVNVLSAKAAPKKVFLEPAIIALIALLIVLFVGFVMVIFTCCCIRNWDLSSSALTAKTTMRERLVRRAPPTDALNRTENPLWMDKYVKPYEEQELSMRIAPDMESPIRQGNGGNGADQNNPYATIQKPRRALPSIHLGDDAGDFNDYATLESPYQRSPPRSRPSPMSGLDSPMTTSLTASGAATPHLVLNQNGEPILVADLI